MSAIPGPSSRELDTNVRVLVQPDDGVDPVVELIQSARRSLFIKQFTYTHPALIAAAIAAKAAGVDVRIMLNPHRSSGDRANDATFEQLQKAGVTVEWSNPKFAVTHEKSMVIDDRLAVVATFNFCEKYFTKTRDYGMVLENAAEVAEIRACFLADWERREFHPVADSALLWSNRNSRRIMSEFIDSARHRLDIQHPKFVDATILDRIVQACARGVHVRVLCGGKHGISEWDVLDTFSSLRVLNHLNVKVHKQKNLRLHAKLLIGDDERALVGSMNIDRSAFDLRRELGGIVSDPVAISRLRETFDSDWDLSHRYEAPDPLAEHLSAEDDFAHDPDLLHE